MRPSFIGMGINAILASIAAVLFMMNYRSMDNIDIIKILLLTSIAFGIHALLHHYEEIYYNFNPLVGKWTLLDNKI